MNQKGERANLGVVVSEFNYDITMAMLERAREHAGFLGATIGEVVKVPGVFDIPLAARHLAGKGDIDAVVVLGAVIRGETDHDQVVMQHATRKIMDISVECMKPVALGITGPGMSRLQAHERIDCAKNAVESAIKLMKALHGTGPG